MVGGLEDFGWILGIQRILTIYDHIKLVGGLEDFYTFFMFSYLRNNIPTDELIFFSAVLKPPTSMNLKESDIVINDHWWSYYRAILFWGSLFVCIYIYLFIIYKYTHAYAKISTYVMWDVPLQAVPRACALHPQA